MKYILISFVIISLFHEFSLLELGKYILRAEEKLVKIVNNYTYYHKDCILHGVRVYLGAFKKVLLLFKLGRNKVMKLAKLIYEKKMPHFILELSREMENITAILNMNSTESKLFKTVIEEINANVHDFRLQCQINPNFVGEPSSFDHVLLEITENKVLNILRKPRRSQAYELIFYANKYYALLYDLTRKIKSGAYHYLKAEYLYNAKIPTLLKRKLNYKKLKDRVHFEEGDIEFFEELMTNISTRWTEFMDAFAFKILHETLPTTQSRISTRGRRIKFYRRALSDERIPQDDYTLIKKNKGWIVIYVNRSKPTRKSYSKEMDTIEWYEEFLNKTTVPTEPPRHIWRKRSYGFFRFEK